jgi:hypothetical protein
MALVRKSRGTISTAAMDAGPHMPLEAIDERLKDFRVFYHRETPKMAPRSRERYLHIMIEVTDDDPA